MATLAELELELGRERRAVPRESRRARRLPATKQPKLSPERQKQLRRLAATGEPVRELAEALGIGRATAYRYLSQENSAHGPDGAAAGARHSPGAGSRWRRRVRRSLALREAVRHGWDGQAVAAALLGGEQPTWWWRLGSAAEWAAAA